MSKKIFELRYIFGLKLKELRQEKGITYQELSKRSGLSISYLSEIESGKKYPKGDKIFLLAESLSTSYDELVSLKVPKKLEPIIEVIESDFMKHFPLGEFGLNPQKVIEVVAQNPAKINAFISTIIQVSRNHELTSSKFYYAALKTYQELHDNYFEELETLVEQMHLEFTELAEVPFEPKVVEDVLLKIGVRTDMEILGSHDELTHLRSLYHAKQRLLMLNAGLNKAQQSFLIGREIAFQWMRVKSRPLSTPPYGEYTFEEILNNYKASYFSSALLMPKHNMIPDIQAFADERTWNRELFLRLINRYEATPEMVMQRLTNILPTYFKLKNLFFLRFLKTGGKYYLTKELHLARQHSPHVNELNEHYCRRWLSLQVIEDLESAGSTDLVANAHFSNFIDSKSEYFIMSVAFPNISNPSESISVTIGLLNDVTLKKRLNFIDQDQNIPRKSVNVTCERCAEVDCTVRAAPALVHQRLQAERAAEAKIEKLLAT